MCGNKRCLSLVFLVFLLALGLAGGVFCLRQSRERQNARNAGHDLAAKLARCKTISWRYSIEYSHHYSDGDPEFAMIRDKVKRALERPAREQTSKIKGWLIFRDENGVVLWTGDVYSDILRVSDWEFQFEGEGDSGEIQEAFWRINRRKSP